MYDLFNGTKCVYMFVREFNGFIFFFDSRVLLSLFHSVLLFLSVSFAVVTDMCLFLCSIYFFFTFYAFLHFKFGVNFFFLIIFIFCLTHLRVFLFGYINFLLFFGCHYYILVIKFDFGKRQQR